MFTMTSVVCRGCHSNSDIDSRAKSPAEELQKMGGAKAIIATAPDSKAMTELIGGLGPNGRLLLIGVASDPIDVAPLQLI